MRPKDIENAINDFVDILAANPESAKQVDPKAWEQLNIYKTNKSCVSQEKERTEHPRGEQFNDFFNKILLSTGSSWERDIIRSAKEVLWSEWKAKTVLT